MTKNNTTSEETGAVPKKATASEDRRNTIIGFIMVAIAVFMGFTFWGWRNHNDNDSQSENTTTSVEDSVRNKVVDIVGEDNLITYNYVPENNFLLVEFREGENLTSNMTVRSMYMDICDILKEVKNKLDVDVDINVIYPLTDKYGNSNDTKVITSTYKKETIDKINFDNVLNDDMPSLADSWWNHPSVKLNN